MSIHIRHDETVAALETADGIEDVYAADGRLLGRFTPAPRPAATPVSWDPAITEEELDRRAAGPFVTFDEMKKRLGWE